MVPTPRGAAGERRRRAPPPELLPDFGPVGWDPLNWDVQAAVHSPAQLDVPTLEGRLVDLEDLQRLNSLHLASASIRLQQALEAKNRRPRSAPVGGAPQKVDRTPQRDPTADPGYYRALRPATPAGARASRVWPGAPQNVDAGCRPQSARSAASGGSSRPQRPRSAASSASTAVKPLGHRDFFSETLAVASEDSAGEEEAAPGSLAVDAAEDELWRRPWQPGSRRGSRPYSAFSERGDGGYAASLAMEVAEAFAMPSPRSSRPASAAATREVGGFAVSAATGMTEVSARTSLRSSRPASAATRRDVGGFPASLATEAAEPFAWASLHSSRPASSAAAREVGGFAGSLAVDGTDTFARQWPQSSLHVSTGFGESLATKPAEGFARPWPPSSAGSAPEGTGFSRSLAFESAEPSVPGWRASRRPSTATARSSRPTSAARARDGGGLRASLTIDPLDELRPWQPSRPASATSRRDSGPLFSHQEPFRGTLAVTSESEEEAAEAAVASSGLRRRRSSADEEEAAASCGSGSEDSSVRRRENRRKADRWISETVPEGGRAVYDRALWNESRTRRLEEERFQATVMRSLADRSVSFKEWRQMRQKERMERKTDSSVKLGRVRELPEGSVFRGSVRDLCIVSFPGAYLEQWRGLFELVGPKRIASACVFLPQSDPAQRYGHHTPNPKTPGKCYCRTLYGEKKEWGCLWFKHWAMNVRRAVSLALVPMVVFLPGQIDLGHVLWEDLAKEGDALWNNVGLGGSQKGEVAWLRRKGIQFRSADVLNVHKVFTEKHAAVLRVMTPALCAAAEAEAKLSS